MTLNVGGVSPNVAISGRPASLMAGTSARLFATVIGEEPYVKWTVDGVDSGTRRRPAGRLPGVRGPRAAPPAGQVTIRATTASGAFDEVTIVIADPPPPEAAPTVEVASIEPGPLTEVDRRGLRGVSAVVDRGFLLVSARSGQAGVVRVRARNGNRQLGNCEVRTPAGRPRTCSFRIPRAVAPLETRVVATLRVGGRLAEVVETDAQLRRHGHK